MQLAERIIIMQGLQHAQSSNSDMNNIYINWSHSRRGSNVLGMQDFYFCPNTIIFYL